MKPYAAGAQDRHIAPPPLTAIMPSAAKGGWASHVGITQPSGPQYVTFRTVAICWVGKKGAALSSFRQRIFRFIPSQAKRSTEVADAHGLESQSPENRA
jgi:hypothetical protein